MFAPADLQVARIVFYGASSDVRVSRLPVVTGYCPFRKPSFVAQTPLPNTDHVPDFNTSDKTSPVSL
jgi:hypothetical protein